MLKIEIYLAIMSENHLKILQWAEEDRPREKLVHKGKAVLSDAELIAILIGSGTVSLSAVDLAKMILKEAYNDLNELAKLSIKDLEKFKGIGEAKAISIVAALELGRRRKSTESVKRDKIVSSNDAYELMKANLLDIPHEEFWIIMLNRANQVIKKIAVSKGGLHGTVVDPRLVLKPAIEHLATSLILVHNHPSNSLKPSQADLDITKKLVSAGQIMDINIIDHIIFTDEGYYSFADEGEI